MIHSSRTPLSFLLFIQSNPASRILSTNWHFIFLTYFSFTTSPSILPWQRKYMTCRYKYFMMTLSPILFILIIAMPLTIHVSLNIQKNHKSKTSPCFLWIIFQRAIKTKPKRIHLEFQSTNNCFFSLSIVQNEVSAMLSSNFWLKNKQLPCPTSKVYSMSRSH